MTKIHNPRLRTYLLLISSSNRTYSCYLLCDLGSRLPFFSAGEWTVTQAERFLSAVLGLVVYLLESSKFLDFTENNFRPGESPMLLGKR